MVMTMHSTKGIALSCVLVFGVDEGLVPAECLLKDLPEAERADAVKRRRSLLYVAATRVQGDHGRAAEPVPEWLRHQLLPRCCGW